MHNNENSIPSAACLQSPQRRLYYIGTVRDKESSPAVLHYVFQVPLAIKCLLSVLASDF